MNALRLGSLCSGYGGLDLAAAAVFGAEPVWHAEVDPAAARVLAHRFPGVPNLGDLTALNWADVPGVDVLAAGYPCQPFSLAGLRKGTADARHLWPHIADAVRVLRPRLVLLENVPGHLGLGFDTVLGDLSALRFDAEWSVLAASTLGAAHQRRRLFLLAWPTDSPGDGRREGPLPILPPRTAGQPAHPHRPPAADPTRLGAGERTDQTHAFAAGRYPRPFAGSRGLLPAPCTSDGVKGVPNQALGPCRPALAATVQPHRWGVYAAAIARHEQFVGRAAPEPTEPGPSGPRLAPRFTEWLMALPDGWVTDVPGLTRTETLRILGNGVIPAHGEAAFRHLAARTADVPSTTHHQHDPEVNPMADEPHPTLNDQTRDERRLDGATVLDQVETFMRRFVAFPSDAATVACVLWTAHTHLLDVFDATPRLGFLSPEPGSGKTRALEITELLVPNPMLAVSASTAALFRAVSGLGGRPTILFDEIDTVFGPKAKENEELRGFLNAGHRRSGVSYRCVGDGANQQVVAFPSYAALAMGGLGSLPDTILTRSVIIRMRRRAPTEQVEAYRARLHEPEGHALRKLLAEWASQAADRMLDTFPTMPDGVNDRPADVWEPLLMVADAAHGAWPERARSACVTLLAEARTETVSLGVRLLLDIREAFGEREKLFTANLLAILRERDDAPWSDLKGKPLNEYSLGRFLRDYEISSKNVRIGEARAKGYERTDFRDAWTRYCPPPASGESVPSVPSVTPQLNGPPPGTDTRPGTDRSVPPHRSVPPGRPLTSAGTHGTDGTDSRQADTPPECEHCGEPIEGPTETEPGTHTHTWCAVWTRQAHPVARH